MPGRNGEARRIGGGRGPRGRPSGAGESRTRLDGRRQRCELSLGRRRSAAMYHRRDRNHGDGREAKGEVGSGAHAHKRCMMYAARQGDTRAKKPHPRPTGTVPSCAIIPPTLTSASQAACLSHGGYTPVDFATVARQTTDTRRFHPLSLDSPGPMKRRPSALRSKGRSVSTRAHARRGRSRRRWRRHRRAEQGRARRWG